MTGVLQMNAMLGAGAAALALLWIMALAPWISRTASTRLRASLCQDIEATRSAQAHELMPRVLAAPAQRRVFWLLAAVWSIGFAALWLRVGVSSWSAVAYSLFFAVLFVASLIDLDTQLLPTPMVGAILWAGILAALTGLVPLSLERAVLGAAAGWILFSLPNLILAAARTDASPAVGAGDISFLAAAGAWLGPQQTIAAGCLAVVFASLVTLGLRIARPAAQAHTLLPFGPLISVAAIAMLCFDPYHHFMA